MADDILDEEDKGILPIAIEEEMQKSYMEYAMSVIVSRALPDVRDGLKPVHRRILYAMKENGYDSGKPFRKSARIIGDVMGKYHPHGDQAIYDAMVRMVQDFSMRLPLVSGQGNFGSMDGDPPAAMRYTEARLAKSAEVLLDDIDKQTVPFMPNYDESAMEPQVLPARYPNILVNGGGGIAVGMATNIPPHNLGEVIDACVAILKNPSIGLAEIMKIVEAPDFPTGGIILGRSGINKAFSTGNGSVMIRSRHHLEKIKKDREAIIVTEIPYQVNKARLLERIAEVVREKIVEGVSDIRDESDRDGLRVVIDLKRDANSEIILNQLFKHTPLQQSFGINMLALRDGMPEMLPIAEMMRSFLKFRDETVIKRTRYLLDKARSRVHVLVGLLVAIGNIDEIIDTIKAEKDTASARDALMKKAWKAAAVVEYIRLLGEDGALDGKKNYTLSEAQAKAILELRLQRLTGMERQKLEEESQELAAKIQEYLQILGDQKTRRDLIIGELKEIKKQFATERRTTVEEGEYTSNIEDLIEREEMVVTVTYGGYVKRVPLATYRTQRRGGKGRSGMSIKEDDFVWKVFIADTLTPILFFTSKGMVYEKKVYHIPEGSPTSRGKALVNLLPFDSDEHVTAMMPLPADEGEWDKLFVMFATASGSVRRNKLSDFTKIQSNGKIAMKLGDGDSLVSVEVCDDTQDVFLTTAKGRAMRFPVTRKRGDNEKGVRVFAGRNSTGVRGVKLKDGDKVVSMSLVRGAKEADEADLSTDNNGEENGNINNEYLRTINAIHRLENEEYESTGNSEDVKRDKALKKKFDETPLLQQMRDEEEFVLSISTSGQGQLCSTYAYRQTARGGQGINNMQIDDKDEIVTSYLVDPQAHQLMLITDAGQIIRIPVEGVRKTSRNSKGVKLFNISDGEKIVSCARIDMESTGEEEPSSLDDGDEPSPESSPESSPEPSPAPPAPPIPDSDGDDS